MWTLDKNKEKLLEFSYFIRKKNLQKYKVSLDKVVWKMNKLSER